MKGPGAAHRALLIQFFKFGIVGTIGFIVDASVLMLMTHVAGLGPYSGRAISFIIAVSVTWICNRMFTFRGQGSGGASTQWAKFVTVSAGGFVLNYGTYALLVATVATVHVHLILGVAAGSIPGMFFNFFFARKIVFK
jgi:putative flippase GtrA